MGPDRRPIRQRLAEFYTEPEIDVWLYSPHPQLDGAPPTHVVDAGGAERVHAIIDRLESGAFL